MSNNVILDASALLALIHQEQGADIVKPLLKRAIMSTVNVSEVLTALQRTDIHPKEALLSIFDIIQTIIPFDTEQAKLTAELSPLTKSKGLSLGDRACIALGQKMKLPIYTADKIWGELKLENADINLIR
jgi:PIN domain nuclease of toxin-antitoxin system